MPLQQQYFRESDFKSRILISFKSLISAFSYQAEGKYTLLIFQYEQSDENEKATSGNQNKTKFYVKRMKFAEICSFI